MFRRNNSKALWLSYLKEKMLTWKWGQCPPKTCLERYVDMSKTICRFENLPISSSSDENNMPRISHYNTFYFLKCGHTRYVKCFFTIIQKQQKMLICIKTELTFRFLQWEMFCFIFIIKNWKEFALCKIYAIQT